MPLSLSYPLCAASSVFGLIPCPPALVSHIHTYKGHHRLLHLIFSPLHILHTKNNSIIQHRSPASINKAYHTLIHLKSIQDYNTKPHSPTSSSSPTSTPPPPPTNKSSTNKPHKDQIPECNPTHPPSQWHRDPVFLAQPPQRRLAHSSSPHPPTTTTPA